MEKKVEFKSEGFRIQGLISRGTGPGGIVITHPHPQFGGDMYNPVVESIGSVYQRKNRTTLRFNFRGVGASEGRYSEGVGEREDVLTAVAWLRQEGIDRIDLAGYSFGAWVNAHVDGRAAAIDRMIMVSPPVAFIKFEEGLRLPRLELVVGGSRDEIAPPGVIRGLLPQWNADARFEEIQGADHFYFGYFEQLEAILEKYVFER
ncbi:MAG: alpha/beta hydrolase [Deltaproteobacteria bacterium]|nr:alpha/beta hydrolase [Deltaproteobacteria bacterium]